MSKYVVVPYLGTSLPSQQDIQANGIDGNVEGRKIVCYRPSGNESPLFAFRVSKGDTENTYYISLSKNYNIAYEVSHHTMISRSTTVSQVTYYYDYGSGYGISHDVVTETVADLDEAISIVANTQPPTGSFNIKYSIQNGFISAPSWIAPGGNVIGYITMNAGFTLTQQDITVTRNGTSIPFTYSNGVLSFTAPS